MNFNSKWLPIAIIILILWILFFWMWVCPRCFLGLAGGGEDETTTEVIKETAKKVVPAVTALAPASLLIKDGSAFSATAPKNIDFNKSNYSYITPLSADVNTSLEKTATYLKAHPDRSLTINGIYAKDEKNGSAFPNLGLARANNVKGILSKLGVPGAQLLTSSSLLASNRSMKDIMYSGVNFKFGKTTNDVADRLAKIKARLLGKPLTLYFASGKQEVNLTAQQRTDFSDLVFYLDNVAKSSLEVSGHTDNVGAANVNTRLSRKRAEFVRDYLVGNGLGGKRMNAKGHGPDKPIAKNDTDAGKAKNRRVEVTLR